jgi:hypothetical protein
MKKVTRRWSSYGSVLHATRYAADEEAVKQRHLHPNHRFKIVKSGLGYKVFWRIK